MIYHRTSTHLATIQVNDHLSAKVRSVVHVVYGFWATDTSRLPCTFKIALTAIFICQQGSLVFQEEVHTDQKSQTHRQAT